MSPDVAQIGFVVDNLGPGQASFLLIRRLNDWLSASPLNAACVFVREMQSPCLPCDFPIFSLGDLFAFRGHAVATTFDSALSLAAVQGPISRTYYLQNIEWLYQYRPFEEWAGVFKNPRFHIAVRSPYHRSLCAQCWNVSPAVVEDFAIDSLMSIGGVGWPSG